MKKIRKKVRTYIKNDVLNEAKARIKHIIETFDTIVIMFSGGKDSLAVVHLVKEVYDELGIKEPINVVFRDEELIPNVVIDFVNEYRQKDWINMLYFAVPLYSQKFILGQTYTYVQWDKTRKHVRPIPKFAHVTDKNDPTIFSQDTMDNYTASFFKGKIAFINGIRASESLIRFASCMNKINENYINAVKDGGNNVKFCKPIYDWEENDIFKYFHDRNIQYCKIYDWQMWNGDQFRVATPIHQESAKRFNKLKTLDPILYSQIIDIFPEMLVQERYYKEYDRKGLEKAYSQNLNKVLDYIKDFITDPKQKHEAYNQFKKVVVAHRNDPKAYPLNHIIKYFMGGSYKRNLMPLANKEQ